MKASVCPQCNSQLDGPAARCIHCDTLIENGNEDLLQRTSAGAVISRPEIAAHGNVLPFWKFFLLIMSTGGLYQVFWFYRSWTFVSDVKHRGEGFWSRVAATIGFLVPIVGLFLAWNLFARVHRIAIENKLPIRYSVGWFFLLQQSLTVGFLLFGKIDKTIPAQTGPVGVAHSAIYGALLCAPMLNVYFVQRTINDYWMKHQPNLQTKLTRGQIIIFIFGAFLWASVSYSFYLTWTGQIDSNGNPVTQATNANL
jgi:hypothetical protein